MLQATHCAIWYGHEKGYLPTRLQKRKRPKLGPKVGTAPGTITINVPHPTMADLRGRLGVATPMEWWRTGRAATVHHEGVPPPRARGIPSLSGLGVASQSNWWRTGRPASIHHDGLPGTIPLPTGEAWQITPYADYGYRGLEGRGLGISSLEVNRTISGSGLGIVPTDEELACVYGYTPVHHGWIQSKRGIIETGNLGTTFTPEQKAEADALSRRKSADANESTADTEEKKILKLQKFSMWSTGIAAVAGAALSAATLYFLIREKGK